MRCVVHAWNRKPHSLAGERAREQASRRQEQLEKQKESRGGQQCATWQQADWEKQCSVGQFSWSDRQTSGGDLLMTDV